MFLSIFFSFQYFFRISQVYIIKPFYFQKPHFRVAFFPFDRYERQISLINTSDTSATIFSLANLFHPENQQPDDVTSIIDLANSALDEVTAALNDRRYIRPQSRQVALVVTALDDEPNVDWLLLNQVTTRQKKPRQPTLNLGVRNLAVGSGTLEKISTRWTTETMRYLCDLVKNIQPLEGIMMTCLNLSIR